MRRPVLIASILVLLSACDKKPDEGPPPPTVTISDSATVLFHVFGDRDTLRAAPLAIVEGRHLGPIELDAAGWRALDSTFFAKDRSFGIYRNGLDVGTVEVVRGMWPRDNGVLYSLPGCRNLLPQALLRLKPRGQTEESLEFLASSKPLNQGTDKSPLPTDAVARAKGFADSIARAAGIGNEEIGHLEFIGRWLRTGAGPQGRTLLGTYIDAEAGDAGPGAGHSSMVFILAEDSARRLIPSYSHVMSGEARTVEFQRLVNHADLDGDGIDELIIEVWKYASVPELAVLKRAGGRWAQAFRVSQNWCLDPPVEGAPAR
jgi:hypothetical protein